MFYKIDPHKNVVKLIGKHLYQSFFLEKVTDYNFIKKRLQHKCLTMNFAKLLKLFYFVELLW